MKRATATLLALCLFFLANLAHSALPNFKLRIDQTGFLGEDFIVGSKTSTNTVNFPVTVDEFLGTEPMDVNLSYTIAHGDSQYWTIALNPQIVHLGGSGDKQVVQMTVTAATEAPEGADVNIQVSGINSQTNEIHNAYVQVVKQPHGVSIAPVNYLNGTVEPTSKLVYGGEVTFNLLVSLTGADSDRIKLIPNPLAGFTFQTSLQSFALAPSGFWTPKSRQVKLKVTTPAGWPKGQQATVSLTAQSLTSQAQSTINLEVTKADALWTPSDLLGPKGRRHLVQPGKSTSFLLTINNTLNVAKTFSLLKSMVAPSPGWDLQLSQNQISLGTNGKAEVKVTLTAPADAALGAISDWNITLTDSQGFSSVVQVGAEATAQKKIIYVDVDSLQPDYLYLNAKGTGPGSSGDWLMPNFQNFMAQSTNYKNAFDALPSIGDPNLFNALSGCRTGKSGILGVGGLYFGRDANGSAVIKPGDSSIPRYGPDGKAVPTVFDVAKQMNPKSYTGIATNKNWQARYFMKMEGGADLVLTGINMPPYITPPTPYTLGDPPTDPNPLDPAPTTIFFPTRIAPGLLPSDRWLMNGAIRLLDNEDPDVLYILLGNLDEDQHECGSSSNPAEWNDRGTKRLGDDINLINPAAVRDDPLDVAREADSLFGMLWSYLSQRGALDNTYIVVLSDHGHVTSNPNEIDLSTILAQNGFIEKDDYDIFAQGQAVGIVAARPEIEQALEAALENAPPVFPDLAKNPWVVLDRSEMKTGVDLFTKRTVAKPMELYSEFYVEHEVPSTDQIKWPTLFIFLDGSYAHLPIFSNLGDYARKPKPYVGDHGGPATQHITLMAYGPGFQKNQVINDTVNIADITPTLYHLQGWPIPESVEGTILPGLQPGIP